MGDRIDRWLLDHDRLLTRVSWVGVCLGIAYVAGSIGLR